MNVNTTAGSAAKEIPSSSNPCVSFAGSPLPTTPPLSEKRLRRLASADVNTADSNSQDNPADYTECLCTLSAALTSSHRVRASEYSARTRENSGVDINSKVGVLAESKKIYHSIDMLDKILDVFQNNYSHSTDRSIRVEIKNTTDTINNRHRLAYDDLGEELVDCPRASRRLSQQQKPEDEHSKEIKMRDNAYDLNLECASAAGKDTTQASAETDKRPWTMEVLSVCVSVMLGVRRRSWSACAVGLLTVAAVLAGCGATPAPQPAQPTPPARLIRDVDVDAKTQTYLMRFGYLPQGSIEVGNLIMEDELKTALMNMQAFAGIPVTGEVDDATKQLLNSRRCGRPDREHSSDHRYKRFAIQGSKWNHTDLTWSLSSSRRPSSLEVGQTRRILSDALNVWAQHSRLTFREVASDDADIVVSFARKDHGDAYPFDGRGHILAHAFFPGSGRGGDAHFDDDEFWVLQPKDKDEEGTSLFAVAAHEFGHSLGLSHSSEKGALMYPWYQGILTNYTLFADDRNGIQQMYGAKFDTRQWDKIHKYYPVASPTTTTTRRPHYHHHRHRTQPTQSPRPSYPHYPSHPYDPTRRHYNTPDYPTRQQPRQRPRLSETTTHSYHPWRPEYDPNPRYPYDPTNYNPRYPDQYPRQSPTTTAAAMTSTTKRPDPRRNYPHIPDKKPENPRKQPPNKPPTRATPSDKPDTCDTTYDAVALIRSEVFIFKDKWHWRIGSGGLYEGYPIEITRMWRELPQHLTHVDAVYERPDKKIVFFIGKQYYVFDENTLAYGYPKPLAHLHLPPTLAKLDAAMVWSHNSKTYFYSGSLYWKYDEELGAVEADYPRNVSVWGGIGDNIDSAFQWKDGKTYFFKGKGFWRFNDLRMQVENHRQQPSGPFWMGCPSDDSGRKRPHHAAPPPTRSHLTAAAASPPPPISAMLVAVALAAVLDSILQLQYGPFL